MKILIVDDEPVARAELRRLCAAHTDVEVVGEANSGQAAVAAAEQLCPDLLLLDVGLPDMTGFEVLQAARDERGPLVILVTAREDYAVLAFTAGVVDYLLKPPSTGRFARAIERARTHQGARLAYASPVKTTILIGERDRRLYPLNPANVHYVESDGNYVRIRTSSADYISRDSIKRLAVTLSDMSFVRIERSLLLNLAVIEFVEPAGHGTYTFTLKSGTVLHSSATYREEILRVVPLVRTIKPLRSA